MKALYSLGSKEMSVNVLVDMEALLAPIPGANPAGEDVSYAEYDSLKEARRADEPHLEQGEWRTELKIAQWPKVRELASEVLTHKSKDLQVACWLTESLTYLHGFPGVESGLQVIDGLLIRFWEDLYPEKEDGDLGQRTARLDWLNTYLPQAILEIPVTLREVGGYNFRHWQESRELDNLARKSLEAAQQAIAEGKTTSDAFEKAVAATPGSYYADLFEQVSHSREAFAQLAKTVDKRFGKDAPSLAKISGELSNCWNLTLRIATDKGVISAAPTTETPAAGQPMASPAITETTPSLSPQVPIVVTPAGLPQNREEALRRLNEIALFFRQTEPHSPVSYLIERATKWAKMPLEQWLRDVIKDEGILQNLRETLGIKPPESGL
jgi:type VI secretion system protein ImpA